MPIYSRQYDRFSFSLGLRTEVTETTITEKTIDEEYENNYTDLFPNALLTYSFNDQKRDFTGLHKIYRQANYIRTKSFQLIYR